MINLLIGPPGGGKSYEAVVFHVLPALAAGRLVITNLPLDIERLGQLDGAWPGLIVKVEDRMTPIGVVRAFSTIADYAHPWRHSENGSGPLYVIDECHMAMPRGGTKLEVEEWYALHRHESADVLLITQSYGKLSKSIVDLVQVCYRVKKGTAFGTAKQYIRKVQDGVRGDVVNTSIRKYEKRYFGLYKSHTRGGGSELAANDIIPIWKRWPFIGAALFLTLGVSIFAFGPASLNPMKNGTTAKATGEPVQRAVRIQRFEEGKLVEDSDKTKEKEAAKELEPFHPYAGRALHVVGSLVRGAVMKYVFAVSQNGQVVSSVDSNDLIKLGYKVEMPTPCAVKVSFDNWSKWIICDAPQVSLTGTGKPGTSENREGGARASAGGPGPVLDDSVQHDDRSFKASPEPPLERPRKVATSA